VRCRIDKERKDLLLAQRLILLHVRHSAGQRRA
jgi:hypothetical protein